MRVVSAAGAVSEHCGAGAVRMGPVERGRRLACHRRCREQQLALVESAAAGGVGGATCGGQLRRSSREVRRVTRDIRVVLECSGVVGGVEQRTCVGGESE